MSCPNKIILLWQYSKLTAFYTYMRCVIFQIHHLTCIVSLMGSLIGVYNYHAHCTVGKIEHWACKLLTKVTQHIGGIVIYFDLHPSFSAGHFWNKIFFTPKNKHDFKKHILKDFLSFITPLLNYSKLMYSLFIWKCQSTQYFPKITFLSHSSPTRKSLMSTQSSPKVWS